MKTILFGGILLLAALAIPGASASPCDVGDTSTVCVNDQQYNWGDCQTYGYEGGYTYASATANGETVQAQGDSWCYYDPFWGADASGETVWIEYTGSQGYLWVSVNGYWDNTNSWGYCQLYSNHDLNGQDGGSWENLDQGHCDAIGDLDWGNLVP